MEGERTISEFNEAKFQIYRLNNIWLNCRKFREDGQLIEWKWALDTAQIELNEDAEKLDKKGKQSEEGEEGEIEKYEFAEKLRELDEKIETAEIDLDRIKMYKFLKEKEMTLRKIQNLSGKGAKYRPEDEDFEL